MTARVSGALARLCAQATRVHLRGDKAALEGIGWLGVVDLDETVGCDGTVTLTGDVFTGIGKKATVVLTPGGWKIERRGERFGAPVPYLQDEAERYDDVVSTVEVASLYGASPASSYTSALTRVRDTLDGVVAHGAARLIRTER